MPRAAGRSSCRRWRPAGRSRSKRARRRAPTALSDILVGDVFLCSGQSNMELTVSLSRRGEGPRRGRRTTDPAAHRAARRSAGAGRGPVGGCRWRSPPGDGPVLGGLLLRRARAAGHREGAHGPRHRVVGRVSHRDLDGRRPAGGRRLRRSPRPAAPVREDEAAANQRMGRCGRTGGARTPGPAPSPGSRSPPARARGPTCPAHEQLEDVGRAGLARHDGMVWFRRTVTLTPAQARAPRRCRSAPSTRSTRPG